MKRRLMTGFLVFLSALVVGTSVFALEPGSVMDQFAENNILFYDPSGTDCSAENFSAKPSGGQITWIGDSYSVGAKAKVEEKIPGVDMGGTPPNIQGSKSFGYDINGDSRLATHGDINVSNPSGLTLLKDRKDAGTLRKYVVFALGTNDQNTATDTFGGLIDEMVAIAGSGHTFVLMTPRTLNYSYDTVVAAVKQAAQGNSNILVADWEKAVSGNLDRYFAASDPIHPNDVGYDLFVQTIYSALPSGAATTPQGGSGAYGLSGLQVAWVEQWYSTAQQLSVKYGLPWEAVIAQGILESSTGAGPGTSKFARERNNFFGIGAFDSNPDNAFYYDTPEEGWEGYYKNIQKTATYRNHGIFQGNTITDPVAYIVAAKESGYASDPEYVNKVSRLIMGIQELSRERGWASSEELAAQYPEMLANAAANAAGAALATSSSESGMAYANCVDSSGESVQFVMTDGYVYPMAGATQRNQSSGAVSGLSRLPCQGVNTPNSCHGLRTQYNHWALDLGVIQPGKTANDYDAATGGAVLAMADGKWYSYRDGYKDISGCSSATYQVIKDGAPTDMYWLGHMYYEDQFVPGQTFKAGDVIGHVGGSECTGNGSTAHLHIDRSYSATGYSPKQDPPHNIGFYELFNKLYEGLPEG